jgi:hypothetical protein
MDDLGATDVEPFRNLGGADELVHADSPHGPGR